MRKSIWTVAALTIASIITTSLHAQALDIPTVPDSIAQAHNTIVLMLPASGGYAINHQEVARDDLRHQFHAIYEPRPSKVLVMTWDPARLEADVMTVVQLARAEGVTVYRAPYRAGDI